MADQIVDRIDIRMYRIGTGDCFVLKFFSGETPTFTMMVDCGACKGDSARFTHYAEKVYEYVEGHLDLLVLTHEHLDHLIGFARAADVFDKMTIDNVWVGWTEDPSNELANRLRTRYGKHLRSLTLAVDKIGKRVEDPAFQHIYKNFFLGERIVQGKQHFLGVLRGSLDLYFDEADTGAVMAATGGSEMKRAMDFVMSSITAKTGNPPFYCYPGKKVPVLKGTQGIRFYVLGPPEREDLLVKEEIKDDVYERKLTSDDDVSFISALTNQHGDVDPSCRPFTDHYELNKEDKAAYLKKYFDVTEFDDQRWRNIDTDWLYNAGNLAIRLERFMNNTSLALAIEFEKSGKVILLPGDAQSGNWKGWHDPALKWTITKGDKEKTVTAKDLLARTVCYKVGHHASHNGTASKSGLDLMTSDELVALVPLDYEHIHKGWMSTMPGKGLYKELIRHTRGRVFRIDDGLVNDTEALAERNKWSSVERIAFNASHTVDKDFIEVIIKG